MNLKTIAYGENSTTMGNLTEATGNNSVAMGYGTSADAPSMTALGQFNTTSTNANRLLVVGNGSVSERKDAFTVYYNGDVKVHDINSNTGSATDKVVVADNTGVLKTIERSALRDAIWEHDANNNRIILKNLSNGTARPADKRVTISDESSITADTFLSYNGAKFPDYVFKKYYTGVSDKPNYNFKSLPQVESFIKEKGHLPGYISAKEIAKKGVINIGETQLINVEKIEELYLHTIEQEKKLQEKETKIKELEAKLQSQDERLKRLEALLK